jgi:dodecin
MTAGSTYNVIALVGASKKSWEEAARNAVETAAKSVKDLRVAEIVKLDIAVENGKIMVYRARVSLSFKYHGEE